MAFLSALDIVMKLLKSLTERMMTFLKTWYGISKISSTYNEVPPGEKLAIFGAGNFLEIAINKGVEGSGGGANKLFGIKLNDIIRIEFS